MEQTKNVIGTIFLIIILFAFIIGGYFGMQYVLHEDKSTDQPTNNNVEQIDIRLDKTKDYIYYTNEEEVLESVDIISRDANFNLETMSEVNSFLEQENASIKNSIKYIKDMNDVDLENAEKNDEGIYSLEYRDYMDYMYGEYLSLVINDYYYDIINGVKALNTNSYVVNKTTGERISYDKLLIDNNLDMDQVKQSIRKRLNDTQTLDADTTISIDDTVNNLSNYALYINKNGKLAVSFIVKTNKNNYNDTIELN